MTTPGGPNPNRFRAALQTGAERIGHFAEDQWQNHRRRTCEIIGGAILFGAGVVIGTGIDGNESGSAAHSSVDRCPPGYVSQKAGNPGVAIRRFSNAQAVVEKRITLDQGNIATLKNIRDEFGDTGDNGMGNFLCLNENDQTILSPHAEAILGQLQAVHITVPPYTK